MARVTFGATDPARYRAGFGRPLPELARPGSVLALCHPPPVGGSAAVEYLERVEARGDPCYRCIANVATIGAAPRCGFLARGKPPTGTTPADAGPPPDGSLGL